MSLYRFFLDEQVLSSCDDGIARISLSEEDRKHMKAVRIAIGEHVSIIDADNDYFICEVEEITDDGIIAKISSKEICTKSPFVIDLFQGIPKAGKLEEIVRHGTEVGISAFTPIKCKRSVVKLDEKKGAARTERLARIAKSAAAQSGRDAVPEVNLPIDLHQALPQLAGYDSCILFWEEAAGTSTLSNALASSKDIIKEGKVAKVAVLVGPEGGFDESEVDLVLSSCASAHLATLGPNILRTETAGVVGCALTSYELGGMGASGDRSTD